MRAFAWSRRACSPLKAQTRQANSPTRRARLGYTLVEIVCVMALVVIIASASVPVISTMLTDSRIAASADIVRARIADTRSRALDEGQPWRLACLTNTGVYQLAAESSPLWDSIVQDPDEQPDFIRDQLPPDIIFSVDGNSIFSSKDAGSPGGTWETIAVFLANGSARDDVTVFFGKPGISPLGVQLRAITGTATIQDLPSIQAQAEAQQQP